MTQLHVLILGAAAGGGLPQWNCKCTNCEKARRGDIPTVTQSSIAISADRKNWAILNASPDIRIQLEKQPALYPTELRQSPIKSVLLTNGDVDHIAGLLTLREKQVFSLFATPYIHNIINNNSIFDVLDKKIVKRHRVAVDINFPLLEDVQANLFPVPGKIPLYLENETNLANTESEKTIGVEIKSGNAKIFYVPGCAYMTESLSARLCDADMILFDGTVWNDDEIICAKVGNKTGQRMGHMAINGENGSIAAFAKLNIKRKIFIHMNNTNPVLDPGSAERAIAEHSGWVIAADGMELEI